jgi:hypothetical protein
MLDRAGVPVFNPIREQANMAAEQFEGTHPSGMGCPLTGQLRF